ncbi:MAG TPA: DUF1565 domain-containing protein [Acidimicrobiales bacterium]|nr:DUF1565 domain-containing protein [Acidimicrobiales bacterium]
MSDTPGLRLVAVAADGPGVVTRDGVLMASITAALVDARPGSIIDIGRGRYDAATEVFPLHVPEGVTLRGPKPPDVPREARKHLPTPQPAALVASGSVIEVVGSDVRIEHLTMQSTRPADQPSIVIGAVDGLTVDACATSGTVALSGSSDVAISWSTIEHGRLAAREVRGLTITGGGVTGTQGERPLVEIDDSSGIRVEAMALTDGSTGISVRRAAEVLIGGCAVLATGDAVSVADSSGVVVNGNRLRGQRAVHLRGCTGGEVAANGVERADIAFALVGCTGIDIGANHIREARVAVSSTD